MFFRDNQQFTRALRTLLATVRLERLWDEYGPTPEARKLLETNEAGSPLSSGERVMLLAAWAFWNRSGRGDVRASRVDDPFTLAEALKQLEGLPAKALCSLVRASANGADAVDGWLVEHGQPRPSCADAAAMSASGVQ